VKVGDIVKMKKNFRVDYAFQKMPVGYIIAENGCKAIPQFKVCWFKTGNRFFRRWSGPDELALVTKPLTRHQLQDVLT